MTRRDLRVVRTPVFYQFRIMLKTRSIEQQSTLVAEEPTYPKQLLEIGKATLQDKHLVLDVGGPVL